MEALVRKETSAAVVLAVALSAAGAFAAEGLIPEDAPEAPVASRAVRAGVVPTTEADDVTPQSKTVDGAIGDWTGEVARFGGAAIYSKGEYVYQDHLFDAYGADDGRDAERLALLAPLGDEPRAYRLDPAVQYAQGEFGAPAVGPFTGEQTYGDAPGHQDHADLAEVRVAADASTLWLLARTTTMLADDATAILVLVDTAPGTTSRVVPFSSGLATAKAEIALLLAGDQGWIADLATGTIGALPPGSVAVAATGYVNAVEAAIPRALLGTTGDAIGLAVAAGGVGPLDGDGVATLGDLGVGARIANVAFRGAEPVRIHWEKEQALALHAGSIDGFFATIDLAKLASGATETFAPGPGYHDRIFLSAEAIAEEHEDQGVFQHYGVYLPESYTAGEPAPLQLWLHFRGGLAHTVATVVPRVFQDFGEDAKTIVVSPSGRGTSRWYVGKGHADFREVWDDVLASFSIDRDHVYVSGHSMGGWGTYLLTVLYPDRFAAGMPVAGPVTQGAWTGLDFPGCDELEYRDGGDTYTPCYLGTDYGRARDQHTRPLLDNLRNVPLAVFHGAIDELVPVSGVTRQVEQLALLGYRHRYYLFPTYEHYSHPIVDEWKEGVRYLHDFERNPNPPRVTYRRIMAFEEAVEQVQTNVPLSFDFDAAYWMSELTPSAGAAFFDGRSLAIEERPAVMVPEARGPSAEGQTGPYVMVGLGALELSGPPPATTNAFEATLEGTSAVRLDLARMSIDVAAPIAGRVSSDAALELRLAGAWAAAPGVVVNGAPVAATLSAGVLRVPLASGESLIGIVP